MSPWERRHLSHLQCDTAPGACALPVFPSPRLSLGPRTQGVMGVERGAPHTLLRSLAVTPSSSRQGSLCTNASIWYFALMNSDLMGLHEAVGAQLRKAALQACPGAHGLPTAPAAPLTGLCLAGWLCAGHSALVQGPAGSAPRWSWPHCWQACAPSVGKRCQARECPPHAGH